MSLNLSRRRFSASLVRWTVWLAALGSTTVRGSDAVSDVATATDPFPRLAHAITGGAPIRDARVTIDTPRLADNGHSVPITVHVDSAMTAQDYVRRIVLVSERNPRPLIATFHLTPKSGRAEITTRIRLNKTQRLMALARKKLRGIPRQTADEEVVALSVFKHEKR